MRLMLGGLNGNFLANITLNAASRTEEVLAAVAYATDSELLFDWCFKHEIPTRFYGRLDDTVPVQVAILEKFLNKRSPNYVCKLVRYHHAKVIWWRGYGLYIGSANLTRSAWYKNVEAGCFFEESEITDEMATDILDMFDVLETNATPLTEELLELMRERAKRLSESEPPSDKFWASPSLRDWSGLVTTDKNAVSGRKRTQFLEEWHSTLQQLRDIGDRISASENRPPWVGAEIPRGAQADQFLHAHYYQRTFDGQKAQYAIHFEANKSNPEHALRETISWWRSLSVAPNHEDEMLKSSAPFLEAALSKYELDTMDYEIFRRVCAEVHSIKDYSRRVPNASVSLVSDGRRYTIDEKVAALSQRIWADRSAAGATVVELLHYILYGGSTDTLPERLWDATTNPKWKISGLGISALGEIVGWALPNQFPPRNGRTSKALKSLGYNVRVHVE